MNLYVTNDFLYPSIKIHEKEPRYNETSLLQTNFASPLAIIISRFHSNGSLRGRCKKGKGREDACYTGYCNGFSLEMAFYSFRRGAHVASQDSYSFKLFKFQDFP